MWERLFCVFAMKKYKSVLAALAVMVMWGSLFPMVKMGYAAYEISGVADILLFAGVRFSVCGAVICLFSLLRDRESFRPVKGSILPILLVGLFSVILHYSCTYIGLDLTDSSKTAILKQVGVLFYVSFSFLFFREERPGAKKLFAAALGFLGILFINLDGGGISFGIGEVLILCASFCTVFANIIGKKAFAKVRPVTATGVSQLFGGIALLILGKAMGGQMRFALGDAHILLYICVASTVSYCIWFTVVKSGDLSKLFIIKFAEPMFAALFGALLLGENIWKWQYLVAFLLICTGITLVSLGNGKQKEEK